jgi:hypothetical protein
MNGIDTSYAFKIKLGDYESAILRERLDKTPAACPVYITGLARAGTTLILEILSRHPDVATHLYRDFPMMFTPYFWGRFLEFMDRFRAEALPEERAHKDRIMVTPKSPESMEELLWMAFFEGLHEGQKHYVFDGALENVAFENFYRDHIRKILLRDDATRYVSKANYNLTRIPYLLKIFPDARFVVMVRHPVAHIASLKKQQDLFVRQQRKDPRTLAHTNASGHFEFGLNRRVIDTGSGKKGEIDAAFARGDEIRGWALYWADIYGYVLKLRESLDEGRRDQVKILTYESLCAAPSEKMGEVFTFSGLEHYSGIIESYRDKIEVPSYYSPDFSDDDLQVIRDLTEEVAVPFGYSFDGATKTNTVPLIS